MVSASDREQSFRAMVNSAWSGLTHWLHPMTDLFDSVSSKRHYRTLKVDGLDIFYREAGPRNAQTILLLHGFPTSSHMFRGLIHLLDDRCAAFSVVTVSRTWFTDRAGNRNLRFSLLFPDINGVQGPQDID
jgi:hypothetical protein